MIPFCGYNMGDYFSHWLSMKDVIKASQLPRIFSVNWFRKDERGTFLWPGFGENMRVLKWVFERVQGEVGAEETPIGFLPKPNDLDIRGLKISEEALKKLLFVDREKWKRELEGMQTYLSQFKEHLPKGLQDQLHQIQGSLDQ
jgi:phosphoenolpyruvate carboxykinase (GTP)